MSRVITVGAAQLGPIQKADSRGAVVERMLALMHKAHAKGCELVVFPELALTTFFPRWPMDDQAEVDGWFETAMPSNETQPLFTTAVELGLGFHLGYAELVEEAGVTHRYNTAILVDKSGAIVGETTNSSSRAGGRLSSRRPGITSSIRPTVMGPPRISSTVCRSRPFSIWVFSSWFIAEVEMAKAMPYEAPPASAGRRWEAAPSPCTTRGCPGRRGAGWWCRSPRPRRS